MKNLTKKVFNDLSKLAFNYARFRETQAELRKGLELTLTGSILFLIKNVSIDILTNLDINFIFNIGS